MNSPIQKLASLAIFLLGAGTMHAVPVTNPDTYTATEDQTLNLDAASGVLANDSAPGDLSAILESDVSNGTLTLNANGSFTYIPNPNFHGTDSFTYRASETPSGGQQFVVDQTASSATIDAEVEAAVPGFGTLTSSDSANSELQGTLTATVTPSSTPFSEIHITDFSVSNAENVGLSFPFRVFFVEVASVGVDADSGGITIDMVTPSPASPVDGSGGFSQLQNITEGTGTVDVTATGAAAGQVPEGIQEFGAADVLVDLVGTITQSGSTLTLTTPFSFVGDFEINAGSNITLDIDGTIVATSQVQTPELSAPTTVTITVAPVNDAPVINDERYTAAAGSPLNIPVSLPGSGTQTLVDTGATWKYLDDGSDQGSAWTASNYNDTSWASGASSLGYGDNQITVIGFGGDSAAKHITSYFRHQFNVSDPEAQSELTLRLMRDDGAAVYLNGVEIARSNLPASATFSTVADSAVEAEAETHFYEFHVPSSLLTAGTNTLAAQIHQASPGSSDLSFDLQLIRQLNAGGVLANDSDLDGDSLTATVHENPSNGALSLSPDGSFTYTPNAGFVGTDSFTYAVQDSGVAVDRALIPFGDDWKYLDDGSNQGIAWRDSAFDDSAWSSGPGELGYGEAAGDQATEVGFGLDANNKFATTYFRNHFFIGNVAELPNAVQLQLVRDDAAAIYVNGIEIYRDTNLPSAAAFNTFATTGVADENEIVVASVPLSSLSNGRNTIAVEVHQASPTSSDLAFHLALSCSLPAESPIVPLGSVWKYEDSGDDLGATWTAANFDDSLWLSGAGELGYGDNDETTQLVTPSDPKPLTVYFRHTFTVPDASQVQTLAIDLIRDDGIAVYLNGTEIVRDNLSDAAAFDTPASSQAGGDDESEVRPFIKIDPTLLIDGENVITAEVHQASDTSSDLSFDLQIRAAMTESLGIATIDVIGVPFVDSDNDGMDDNWESTNGLIVGTNDSALDADGDGRTNLEEFLALTNPQDPVSLLKITSVSQAANADLTVNHTSTPGKTYQLQHSPDLQSFTAIGSDQTATAALSTFTVTSPSLLRGYLRVVVLP